MTVRHVRRFAPPWAGEPRYTFCGRPISPAVLLAGVEELRNDLEAAMEAPALPNMPEGVYIGDIVGDKVFAQLCKKVNVCQLCMKTTTHMRSWEQNQLLCLSQHADFIADRVDPHLKAEAIAELLAIAQLVRNHQDEFAETARRERTQIALLRGSAR